jgi:hypothetical protein
MTTHERDGAVGVASTRTVEIVVAGLLLAVAAVVIWDSRRLGASWGDDGPQAGYVPFYVGLILAAASIGNLLSALFDAAARRKPFVGRAQAVLVLQVLIPATVFVGAVGWLGIYVSAALYIGFFMAWLGRYPPARILPVAVLVPLAFFFVFEIWFLVPLPKGPLEAALGY